MAKPNNAKEAVGTACELSPNHYREAEKYEKAVIAGCLLDPRQIPLVAAFLKPTHFHDYSPDPANGGWGSVYAAILEQHRNGDSLVSIAGFYRSIKASKLLDSIGKAEQLAMLIRQTVPSMAVEHAKEVREMHAKREIILYLSEAIEIINQPSGRADVAKVAFEMMEAARAVMLDLSGTYRAEPLEVRLQAIKEARNQFEAHNYRVLVAHGGLTLVMPPRSVWCNPSLAVCDTARLMASGDVHGRIVLVVAKDYTMELLEDMANLYPYIKETVDVVFPDLSGKTRFCSSIMSALNNRPCKAILIDNIEMAPVKPKKLCQRLASVAQSFGVPVVAGSSKHLPNAAKLATHVVQVRKVASGRSVLYQASFSGVSKTIRGVQEQGGKVHG